MGKIRNLFLAFLGASLAIATLFFLFRENPLPPGVVTHLPSKGKWIRPRADAETLAGELTLDQLIDRWNRWPAQPGDESVHAVYAKAIGLYGEDAESAVPHLARAVKHRNPNLRRSIMDALVSIGEAGLPPLIDALQFRPPGKDRHNVALEIRWDAAEFLSRAARNNVDITQAVLALGNVLTRPDTYVFTRSHAADALIYAASPESYDALKSGRNWLYAQDGLTVEETRILKSINIALRSQSVQP